MNQKGLGRGLSALLPEADSKETHGSVNSIPIKEIRPNPRQPRREFRSEELSDLAASIKAKGVIQPLIVRKSKSGKGFELVAGERRLRAAELAGFAEVPVRIIDVTGGDREMLELAMVENVQREDLNVVELARGYSMLAGEYGLTQDAIAERIGKNRATVANTLRLLELPDTILNALRSNEITTGHAKALLMVQGAARQSALFKRLMAAKWSVRQTEEAARTVLKDSESPAKPEKPEQTGVFVDQSDRLRRKFGTQVKITRKGKKGVIRIEFYSDDDLERLMELLGR